MTKRDAILTLIVLIVLTALITLETNETLKEVQTTADVLNHRINSNMAVIGTYENLISAGRYERVENLRMIEKLIMECGFGELKSTRN